MDRRTFTQSLAVGCLAAAGASLDAQEDKEKQEWGNLSVTFVYDGEVPEGAIAPPAGVMNKSSGRPASPERISRFESSVSTQ